MFKQNSDVKEKIVDGKSGTLCIYDDNIVFSPPLYLQRYQKVKEKIASVSKGTFTKVVDLGCAEFKFFRYLQSVPGVQEVVLLDKDHQILKDNEFRINPLAADFLILRDLPLNVKVVCGDARKYDPVLSGTQVVTMIELIEHVQISELHALVKCVFQDVRPKLIIITTPNADFNKYFPGHMPGSFRHWDHKFEWTAEEFRQW
ncbi:Small RNA 2'-O-methyltransferase-like 1 [Homarus americanus]|uniref:Small RNA 2'-O-methyltransferase n=2 Tax=Homarus americanus TaxID=6706 RepID=A0A8J5JU99_HOMAM|nr:Small RNA 2'-O-methyltransferase-like 1 [Homarus americanus]